MARIRRSEPQPKPPQPVQVEAQPETLDISTADPRIAGRLHLELVQVKGSMPNGWMGSFDHTKGAATKEDLAAKELEGIPEYAAKARSRASESDALLAEVGDTPANRAAIYNGRLALLNEAAAYYNPVKKRPGAPLTGLLHWLKHTKESLTVANENGFSAADRLFIIRGRLNAIGAELAIFLEFVKHGGWNNALEREAFCDNLEKTPDATARAELLGFWQAAGGGVEDFNPQWEEFQSTITEYHQKFLDQATPEQPPLLGAEGVKKYLERVGVAESPQELIEWCKGEAKAIRAELNRLRALCGDEVEQLQHPDNDAMILAEARETTKWYQTHLVESGIIPSDVPLSEVTFEVFPEAQASDLNFASINLKGEIIKLMPASAQEQWGPEWPGETHVVHELTHRIQIKPGRPIPFTMSQEAREGAAVAAEWLWLEHAETVTPKAMYSALLRTLRGVVRIQLGLAFHTGKLTVEQLPEQVREAAQTSTNYQFKSTMNGIQQDILMNGAYYFGSRLISALAKHHGGNLTAAMQNLAKQSGLRLTGHVLIPGAKLNQFPLTQQLPPVPEVVRISQRRFKDQPVSSQPE